MPTGDAYSSGHLVPSHLGLAYVLNVEINPFLELIFSDYALQISLDFAWNVGTKKPCIFLKKPSYAENVMMRVA